MEGVTLIRVALRLLPILLLACVLVGCEKDKKEAATQPVKVAGASPGHYLTTAPTDGSTRTVPVVRVKPATRPTGAMLAGATCMTAECHATFISAPQIHGPVSKGACNSCHQDDIGGHVFPLKHKGNANCTFCHTVINGASHLHKAVEQGCTSCHQPHISNAKFLLKADNVERTCAICHDVPLKKYTHDPVAKGECTLCHQPHESENAMLLRGGEGAQHCFTCHASLRDTMKTAAVVHKPAKKDCNLCHNPHASDIDHQLRQSVSKTCLQCHDDIRRHVKESPVAHGAMLTDKSCGNCHDAHAASQPQLLRHRTDALCLTCHDKPISTADGRTIMSMKAVLTQSKFLHGPNRVGNCSACHDPHGSKLPNLLERAFPDSFYARFDIKKYDLCFSCHEPQLVLTAKTDSLTNFRDGDQNLHFVHVNRDEKGRSCRTCHDVHGSNLPRHMAGDVPFEGSGWSMPIAFEQTSNGGSCAPGCHTPRTYSRAATTLPSAKPAIPTTFPTLTTQPTAAAVQRGVR